MEQTESVIIRIAPDVEEHKIAEMQRFGWNLQTREEVVGLLGESATPDNIAVLGRAMRKGAPGKETYKLCHYVELHFVRARYGWEAGLLQYWDQCPAVSARLRA